MSAPTSPDRPSARPQGAGPPVTALVLGACSFALCWVPVVSVVAAMAGAAGTVLGVVALRRSRRTGADPNGAITVTVLSCLGLVAALFLTAAGAHLLRSTAGDDQTFSGLSEDGLAVGPMTRDVHIDECYDAHHGLQTAGITVINRTGTPKRYDVTVAAHDQAGRVVGQWHARSGEIQPGGSEQIAGSGSASAPIALCVVSGVVRR